VAVACSAALGAGPTFASTGQATPGSSAAACLAPESLAAAGETAAAGSLFVKALEAHPGLPCAVAGARAAEASLAQSARTAAKEEVKMFCQRGDAYRKVHRSSDAIDSYKAALAKDSAKSSCGEKGLRDMDSWWLPRAAQSVASALPEILLGLGLLLLAALLVLMTGYAGRIGARFKRIWGIRFLLRGRLSLTDCDDSALAADMKVGKVVTAGIREGLQRFREEAVDPNGITYGLDFGTGSEGLADIVSGSGQLSGALAKLGEASEHTKIVAALAGVLVAALPIKRLSFSSVLEPALAGQGPAASEFSAGAKLFIERDSKLVAVSSQSGRLLAIEPVAADYVRLAAPAAVWVQYEVARELSDAKIELADAESYALVREGLEYLDAHRYPDAEEAFERALEVDPRNWEAHVNLAMTKAHGSQDYPEARAILLRALEDMRNA
jgi:tetratricopeptide (TPR) repeat protein